MNNSEKLKYLMKQYCTRWDSLLPLLQKDMDDDLVQYSKDDYIAFKWTHLMQQEIEMWIRLCSSEENPDQVSMDDFEFIVERRGFTECSRRKPLDSSMGMNPSCFPHLDNIIHNLELISSFFQKKKELLLLCRIKNT